MSRAHSAGPWEIYMDRIVCNVAHHGMHGSLQNEVCSLRNGTNPVANAALIAAAPDLLEALKAVLDYSADKRVRDGNELHDCHQVARAAIDKASVGDAYSLPGHVRPLDWFADAARRGFTDQGAA